MEQGAEKLKGELESLSAELSDLREKLNRGDVGDLIVPSSGQSEPGEPKDLMQRLFAKASLGALVQRGRR